MKLSEVRKRFGITQKALSELSGYPQTNISEIESGIHFPTPTTQRKIEGIIGPVGWIETRLDGTGDGGRKIVSQIIEFLHSHDTMTKIEKIEFLEGILNHAKPHSVDMTVTESLIK